MVPAILFFGVLAVLAVVLVVTMSTARKRREAWQAVAPKLALRHLRDVPMAGRFPGFKLFSLGRSRVSDNLLEGSSGSVRVLLGDYRYTVGRGKSATTCRFTVCILEKAGLGLPHSFLRPQNLFDALGKLLGGQDIDFAEDPEFSRAFVLQGEEEGAIRSRFDRPSRSWLVAHKQRIKGFEARGDAIAFFAEPTPPEEAPQLLDEALQLLLRWA